MDIKRYNSVFLCGTISSDIDVHYIDFEKPVLRFTLEVEEQVFQNNNTNTYNSWHKIVAHNDIALVCERLLKKGISLYIEGRLVYRKYTDKNAITHNITEIYLQDFELIKENNIDNNEKIPNDDEQENPDWLFDFSEYKLEDDESIL